MHDHALLSSGSLRARSLALGRQPSSSLPMVEKVSFSSTAWWCRPRGASLRRSASNCRAAFLGSAERERRLQTLQPGSATRACGLRQVREALQSRKTPRAAGSGGAAPCVADLANAGDAGQHRFPGAAEKVNIFWSCCRSRRCGFMSSCCKPTAGPQARKIMPWKSGE